MWLHPIAYRVKIWNERRD